MHPLSRLCLAGETTSVSPDAIESPLIDSNCWRISDSVSPKTCFQSRRLLQVEPLGLFGPRAGAISLEHGVLRSCVDGSGLAREIFTSQAWSVQPCVRPVDAVHMTAGHNALRGSGAGQKPAFSNC